MQNKKTAFSQERAAPGQYNAHVCRSPSAISTPESSSSDEHMNNNGRSDSPPESLGKHETTTPPLNFGRLSLEHDLPSSPHRGRGQLSVAQTSTSKRSATPKVPWLPGGRSPIGRNTRSPHPAGSRIPPAGASRRQRKRQQQKQVAVVTDRPAAADARLASLPEDPGDQPHKDKDARWPGLILQPESSPISQEQLAAEVKGIYAGLVLVEAKCIKIDAAQATDTTSSVDQEQWQELIALHRTLLYQHYDFLMATQYPSATPALRHLATKYSMPARMWKHGIHAFLEVLRHRRPDSQEFMLAFIQVAEDMMKLAYGTVPSFLDTWIECVGDITRYRMAIEEDKEGHAHWGRVAASWYIKAADRHPYIGRLYHHLGILERLGLRKFAYYGKALTCIIQFPNAKDTMKTLCDPIVHEDQVLSTTTSHSTEASFCKVFALIFLEQGQDVIQKAVTSTLSLIPQPNSLKWKDYGVSLAITSISAMFGFNSSSNKLRSFYDLAIKQTNIRMGSSAASLPTTPGPGTSLAARSQTQEQADGLLETVTELNSIILHRALQGQDDSSMRDVLPYLHVILGFMYSISYVCKTINNDCKDIDWINSLLHLDGLWSQLAAFLNILVRLEPITARIEQSVRAGEWIRPEKEDQGSTALPEDYDVRGLVWAFFMFREGWFSNDEDDAVRTVGHGRMLKERMERTLYWALRLSFDTNFIAYEPSSRSFSVPNGEACHQSMGTSSITARGSTVPSAPSATPPSSTSDGDFVHVRRPNTTNKLTRGRQQKPQGWAASTSGKQRAGTPKKSGIDDANVQVVDEDVMEWEMGE